ncbi:FtsX-like permease family protein [Maribellus comscasis]|uniref:FtsX-like permease family protein n=1 Tax=Maribellus comscasis TaxID=2681766 RepID=A0A6I6K405_9BACT|nr:ABC transporter permease [Maribellus comscasis]QGY44684.1 FtsX-like permease family protein [Maribellus comscasis]
MKNFLKLAFRRLLRKGEHTTTRIISLIAGLAFGILLLSEVLYYYSFDSFYPNASRIYIVQENFKRDKSSNKMDSWGRVSGAVAPGLKAEVPGIEAATRLNSIGSSVFYTEDKKSYSAQFSLADEHLFDVLPRPMINGNPKDILSSPMTCMISSKIANEMGGDITGKIIELKEYPGRKLTIAGVFEELPENTNYEYDVLISMISTGQFFSWDGSTNWLGNDRYYAAVKLAPGVDPESLAPAIRKMQIKYQDIESLEQQQGGMVLKYTLKPIKKLYSSGVKDMILILATIAFAVLFVSLMNYTLLTLSALIKRAKSSAIHKTCGAEAKNLQQLIFSETFVLFLISFIGAFLLILVLKPLAEAQVGHKLISVLNPVVIWPLLFLIITLVILTSYLPGRFFSRVPVATAFRNFQQKKNRWKLVLLSFQFVGASFILTMLVIVSMQYGSIINANHGYRTKGVYYGSTSGMEAEKISTLLNELRAVPGVETVGMGCGVPIEGASGNNINSPDKEKELFNVADFYWIDENYLSILNIPVPEGEGFTQQNSVTNDVLISEKGAEKLKVFNGWKNVVGEQVDISEHGQTTIRGVFPDFIINTITAPDLRPSVFFYFPQEKFEQVRAERSSFSFYILLEVNETAEAGMSKKITDIFNQFLPHQDAVVHSLEQEQKYSYQAEKGFRNAMMAGNIVILLITIIGLLGYTSNEAARRRKELAIRRISGANLTDILRAFIVDLEYIAIPAVLLGLTGAWITAHKWMQNFASKIDLHWGIFVACSLFVLLMVAVIAAANYTRTANRNPVEALRYE